MTHVPLDTIRPQVMIRPTEDGSDTSKSITKNDLLDLGRISHFEEDNCAFRFHWDANPVLLPVFDWLLNILDRITQHHFNRGVSPPEHRALFADVVEAVDIAEKNPNYLYYVSFRVIPERGYAQSDVRVREHVSRQCLYIEGQLGYAEVMADGSIFYYITPFSATPFH